MRGSAAGTVTLQIGQSVRQAIENPDGVVIVGAIVVSSRPDFVQASIDGSGIATLVGVGVGGAIVTYTYPDGTTLAELVNVTTQAATVGGNSAAQLAIVNI